MWKQVLENLASGHTVTLGRLIKIKSYETWYGIWLTICSVCIPLFALQATFLAYTFPVLLPVTFALL
jgi:hypothetical protein